ncbi:hypothetical protein KUTeg_023665, partial [Tegillarca granosa]
MMAAEVKVRVFNTDSTSKEQIKSALDLSKKLQKCMLKLKGKYMDGQGVDYEKLRSNIYNALTIHGLAEQKELPSSILDIQQFWKTTAYNIGGHVFCCDDIEHGILRGNRGHPASRVPPFKEKDPRLKYICKSLDPRIHFALVCGAVSCPVINVYTAENIDTALDSATRNFCKQEVSMFTEVDEIWMSKIFDWYNEDFGRNDVEVIKWTIPFLEKKIQDRAWVLIFKIENLGRVQVKYNEYDWRLNRPVNLNEL